MDIAWAVAGYASGTERFPGAETLDLIRGSAGLSISFGLFIPCAIPSAAPGDCVDGPTRNSRRRAPSQPGATRSESAPTNASTPSDGEKGIRQGCTPGFFPGQEALPRESSTIASAIVSLPTPDHTRYPSKNHGRERSRRGRAEPKHPRASRQARVGAPGESGFWPRPMQPKGRWYT